jgi:EF-P beta-lysylation protein EpmB
MNENLKDIRQEEVAFSIQSLDKLLAFLSLERKNAPYQLSPAESFSLIVSQSFASRMIKGNWFDPLLLQVIPRAEEDIDRQGFTVDAVGDGEAVQGPGILHKYKSRILFAASQQCAMHCRFCFRRYFLSPDIPVDHPERWAHIKAHPEVNELLLSGGDPLMLDDSELETIFTIAAGIPHIKTIRIHSRVPIALPSRITGRLLQLLTSAKLRFSIVLVIHANHPQEISGDCSHALLSLRDGGIGPLLGQSVLLKGINDSSETLARLAVTLLQHGIVPYYLHQLDRVKGAWHFEVPQECGIAIMDSLRAELPGYAVPKYVREIPRMAYKKPIA